jgi:hypothetical protein
LSLIRLVSGTVFQNQLAEAALTTRADRF